MAFWDWIKKKIPKRKKPTPPPSIDARPPPTGDPITRTPEGYISKDRGTLSPPTTGTGTIISPPTTGTGTGTIISTPETPPTSLSKDIPYSGTRVYDPISKQWDTTGQTKGKIKTISYNPITEDKEIFIPDREITPTSKPELIKRPYTLGDDLTMGEATKLRFKKYIDKDTYRKALTRAVTKLDPIGAIGLLSPFTLPKRYRERKGDKFYTPDMPYSGTKVYNPNTGRWEIPEKYKGKTKWEQLQEQQLTAKGTEIRISQETEGELLPVYKDIITGRSKTYQDLIDTGELTKKEAQSYLDTDIKELEKKYKIEAQDLYTTKLSKDPLYTYKEYGGFFKPFKIIETPLSSKVTYEFEKASQFKEGGENAFASMALVAGSFIPPVAPYVYGSLFVSGIGRSGELVSQKRYGSALVNLGIAGLGAYGSLRSSANLITKSQIKDVLAVKPKTTYSGMLKGKDYTLEYYKSSHKLGSSYAYTEGIIKSRVSGKTFEILGGRSTTRIITTDYWTGKPLAVGGSQEILSSAGSFYPSLAQKGFIPSKFDISTSPRYDYSILFKGKEILSAKARYKFYSGSPITITPYGAISKRAGDYVFSFSGKIKEMPFTYFKGKGFTAVDLSRSGYKFNIENIGITKSIFKGGKEIYFNPYTSSGLKANLPTTGTGTQLETPFILRSVSKYNPDKILSISKTQSTEALIYSQIYPSKTTTTLTDISKSFEVSKTSIISPITLKPRVIEKSLIKSIPISGAGVIPSYKLTKQSQLPALNLISGVGLIQPPKITTKLTPLQIIPPPTSFTFSTGFPFNRRSFPRFFPIIPSIGMDTGKLGKRRIPTRKIVEYTPSYSAFVFNIFGKKPTGIETGLRVRPIPRGFSFINIFGERRKKIKRKSKRRKIKWMN
jgi:hypothetical protein